MLDHRLLKKHSSGSIGGAASVTVPASCDQLWRVVTSIDCAAEYSPSIVSVERLDSSPKHSEMKVGSKWREMRLRRDGRRVVATVTVFRMTSGDDDEEAANTVGDAAKSASYPRSVSCAATYEKPHHGITSSCTLTVRPCEDGKKEHSVLEGTFAAAPVGFVDKVKWKFCLGCFKKEIAKAHEHDLDQIVAIAARLGSSSPGKGKPDSLIRSK
eukprot:CAMPEP_0197438270 /NCGR_PEP_ID=MMETSP1175-20131217/5313_1 /TAXON_ID=1003142 /ORGANISM="Triceratium dubium, Strain CCMP147" /LENGTH=212 /DNA_ID=CAMNT_0042967965 /DNA_START=107 /DNA_END=745 /DNA_ORIENTATION=+